MSDPYPTREQLLTLARRRLHGMSAATKTTLEAELQREMNRHEATQEQLDEVRRQNYTLGDFLREHEELILELEATNQVSGAEVRESREEIRKGKQRMEATEDYIRRLEQYCEELDDESARQMRGAAGREKDLRMELNAENVRAQELEHSLHLQDEKTRQIIEWQMKNLEEQHALNVFLDKYNAVEKERVQRFKLSQKRSNEKAYNIRKTSSRITHQGEYQLAGCSKIRKAKGQTREQRSIMAADSDVSMMNRADIPQPIEVDDVVAADDIMQSPPPPIAVRLKSQYIQMAGLTRCESPEVQTINELKLENDVTTSDCAVWQSSVTWGQYRKVSAGFGTDSSDSDAAHPAPIPPRKKRTCIEWNSDDDIPSSPKRRRFSGEDPEFQPKMQRLGIDQSPSTFKHQAGPLRLARPSFRRWVPFKRAAIEKHWDTQEAPNRTPVRQIELPEAGTYLLAAAAERQRLDARGRSLSLNDLPQLPPGQMPGMWPSNTPAGSIDLILECQRAWRCLVDWFLRLLREQPRELLACVGLVALVWLWHGHRVYEDWMATNEIPFGVMSELRNARVSEIRWVESLVFGVTKWLDIDRSLLG